MTTDLELVRLELSLSFWEYAGYASLIGVIICCLAEYAHVEEHWCKPGTWWTRRGGAVAARLLVVALALELATQFRTNQISGRIIAQQNRDAAITEERLLNERRLTSRERMVLQFVWRAVVPRSELINRSMLVNGLKSGHFPKINLAIAPQPEPGLFGIFLMGVLQDAGLLGRVLNLPNDSVTQNGLEVASNDPSQRLGEMFWQKFGIGGGGVSLDFAKKLLPVLADIPSGEICLIVGEKDEAMQGMPGQDGEGVDKYGGAVPP